MRSHLLFFCGFLCLAAALYFGQKLIFNTEDVSANVVAEKPAQISVLTLTQASAVGDIIQENSVEWIDVAVENFVQGQIRRTDYTNKKRSYFSLTDNIDPGSVMYEHQVIWPSDVDFIVKTLRPAYRALAVSFDQGHGLLSTLRPGRFLDIVYTGTNRKNVSSDNRVISHLAARNIRILSNGYANNFFKNSSKKSDPFELILEVNSVQAASISRAGKTGMLVPMLRSENAVSELLPRVGSIVGDGNPQDQDNLMSTAPGGLITSQLKEPRSRVIIIQRASKIAKVAREKRQAGGDGG